MKLHINSLCIGLLAVCCWACGPTPPTEAEIRAKIVGNFCAPNYRLEITDSTYRNIKYSPSVLGTGVVREYCKSRYKLEYRDDAWYIDFERDERPNAVFNCERSYPLWTKENRYLIGDKVVKMKDLFDEKELTKAACDDF